MFELASDRRLRLFTVRQVCQDQPSRALVAMCDGLEAAYRRYGFRIDLFTRGASSAKFCYAGAATCAIQELFEVQFGQEDIKRLARRASVCSLGIRDLGRFERAMQSARLGDLRLLYEYFDAEEPQPLRLVPKQPRRWYLNNDDWQRQLPAVRRYAAALQQFQL